jgi:UDP-N-acetylglucosamine 4,6-dehydratase
MTRFWITLDQGVRFVARCIEQMHGGEVFVPKLPSMRMMDLAAAVAPEALVRLIGIRPGEKLHETLLSDDEARHTPEFPDMYRVQPPFPSRDPARYQRTTPLPDGFSYTSDGNTDWLTDDEIRAAVAEVQSEMESDERTPGD